MFRQPPCQPKLPTFIILVWTLFLPYFMTKSNSDWSFNNASFDGSMMRPFRIVSLHSKRPGVEVLSSCCIKPCLFRIVECLVVVCSPSLMPPYSNSFDNAMYPLIDFGSNCMTSLKLSRARRLLSEVMSPSLFNKAIASSYNSSGVAYRPKIVL